MINYVYQKVLISFSFFRFINFFFSPLFFDNLTPHPIRWWIKISHTQKIDWHKPTERIFCSEQNFLHRCQIKIPLRSGRTSNCESHTKKIYEFVLVKQQKWTNKKICEHIWTQILQTKIQNRHETPVLDHPIKIIYVDNDLVVLDKPCSLPVSKWKKIFCNETKKKIHSTKKNFVEMKNFWMAFCVCCKQWDLLLLLL